MFKIKNTWVKPIVFKADNLQHWLDSMEEANIVIYDMKISSCLNSKGKEQYTILVFVEAEVLEDNSTREQFEKEALAEAEEEKPKNSDDVKLDFTKNNKKRKKS